MPKSVEEILENLLLAPYKKQGAIINDEEKQQVGLAKADLLKLIMGVKPRKRPYEGGRNRRAKLFNSALAEWEEGIEKLFK